VADVLHRAAGPDGHLVAVAGLVGLLAAHVLQIRDVVVHHLVVVLIVAGREHDALLAVELDVALFALGDDARNAALRVAHELLGLGVVEHLDADRLSVLGQSAHAVARVVGLRAKVDRQVVQAVAVDVLDARGPLRSGVGHLGADLLRQSLDPCDGLAGVLGPELDLLALAAELVLLEQVAHDGLNASRVGLVEQDARCGVALRNGRCLFLNKSDLRAVLSRGDCSRNASGASADDHDVVVLGFLDVLDGLGSLQERRNALTRVPSLSGAAARGSCGRSRAALAARRASTQERCASCASGREATNLKDVAT